MEAPCKNCDKRTKPKTCEKDCPLWNQYKIEQRQKFYADKVRKSVERRIRENIRRNEWR